jgi:hypothetical protein
MLWRILKQRQQVESLAASPRCGSASLQVVLWTVWTLVVVAVGYFNGRRNRQERSMAARYW